MTVDKVQVTPSRKMFKFGDSRKVYLKYQAKIPAKIYSKDCFIQTKLLIKNTFVVK